MLYAYKVRKEGDLYFADMKEIPSLSQKGYKTEEELDDGIAHAFTDALEYDFRRKGLAIPAPEVPVREEDNAIVVTALTQARILLWNYMVKEDLTASWVCRRANANRQEVQRILDFNQNVSIEKVEKLISALGFAFSISMFKL